MPTMPAIRPLPQSTITTTPPSCTTAPTTSRNESQTLAAAIYRPLVDLRSLSPSNKDQIIMYTMKVIMV